MARKLNPKQELFCKLYASDREFFGNGVQSYIEAYDPDTSAKNWYSTARVSAHDLLTRPNVIDRINGLLEEGGLNDSFVDKQLLFIISQHADFSSKTAAIREYNKLKQRITDKTETKVIIPPSLLGGVSVPANNSHTEDIPATKTT